jgi:hypothetical protein
MRAWERLGLCPTPHGDSFYLAVGAPQAGTMGGGDG